MTKNERLELLRHALIGYQAQHEEIGKRMADLRRRLGLQAQQARNGAAAIEPVKRKSRISKAARRRIAAATRERWRKARAAGRATLG